MAGGVPLERQSGLKTVPSSNRVNLEIFGVRHKLANDVARRMQFSLPPHITGRGFSRSPKSCVPRNFGRNSPNFAVANQKLFQSASSFRSVIRLHRLQEFHATGNNKPASLTIFNCLFRILQHSQLNPIRARPRIGFKIESQEALLRSSSSNASGRCLLRFPNAECRRIMVSRVLLRLTAQELRNGSISEARYFGCMPFPVRPRRVLRRNESPPSVMQPNHRILQA